MTKAKPKAKVIKVKEDFQGIRLIKDDERGIGYEACYAGQSEKYFGQDAFSVCVKRFKLFRGF